MQAVGPLPPPPANVSPLSFINADPSLLVTTMSTFCRLGSLEELRSLKQDAVQACCRLTSATLQPNCWDACAPPPAVSEPVLVSAAAAAATAVGLGWVGGRGAAVGACADGAAAAVLERC